MRFFRSILLLGTLCAAALGLSTVAQAIAPLPGTLISSQALMNYVDPVLFITRNTPSNTVRVLITGGPGLDLIQNNTLTRTAGSFFEFNHTLTNTGNTTGNYTITPSLNAGPVGLLNLRLVLDANGNGTIDLGESILPFSTYTLTLPAGGVAHFILSGQVTPTLAAGLDPLTIMTLGLGATLAETGQQADNIDTLKIAVAPDSNAGALQFIKSVNPSASMRGATVDYTLTGTNNYADPLEPVTVSIDGTFVSRFIVRDGLPANMELVQIITSNHVTPLYHIAGTPLHEYLATPPADMSLVSAVAWAFQILPPGASFSVSYRARVGLAASGVIPNIATAYYNRHSSPESTDSNNTNVTTPTITPTILYYNNHNDADPKRRVIPATRLGNPLYVEAVAGACNIDSNAVEQVTITITSGLTGDSETFQGIETGPNSGAFRILPFIPTEDARLFAVVRNDGIIQTRSRDTLTAEIRGCGSVTVNTKILIDPAGIVFDSRTNVEVAGATVTLIDESGAGNGGHPGALATVLDDDGVNPVSATQVTGADGVFRYPLVAASTYRLLVTPPADHSFPSVVPVGLQPAGRTINLTGSFGQSFAVNIATGTVFLDVPLDTKVATGLALEKKASRETAEVGDSVIYTLKLSNTSGAAFNGTFIDDRLPTGFRYEYGSTTHDGLASANPQGGVGPSLRFTVGTLANGASTTFTYRVRLTPGAEKGDGINIAQATALGPPVLVSNVARARVRPTAGILAPTAVIIGTVFVDTNGNDIQDPGEPGVPGVRLILEDGTYAITDAEGQYSIYGQRAITHALKLDANTLPVGAKLGGNSPRFAGDQSSRFVDLKKFELHKANFLLVEPTPALFAAVAERRKQAESWTPEIANALQSQFNPDGTRTLPTDIEGREAAGLVGSGGAAISSSFNSLLPSDTLTAGNSSLPPSPVSAVPLLELEKLIPAITDSTAGFIGLKDGDTLPFDRLTVRIKGAYEARLSLLVNGQVASDKRIGKEIKRQVPPLQAAEYVALQLQPGPNQLTVVQSDLFGNERERKTITVTAPDQLAKLTITPSTLEPKADGHSVVDVRIVVVDARGTPVTASLPLTLETTLGRWDVQDVNPREPGVQVFLEGGKGSFRLIAPFVPGESRINVSSGALKADARITFLPELRPMIASGIIEGRFGLSHLARNQLLPTDPGDAFEEELRQSSDIGGSSATGSGRAAFYLKGKVKGDVLLTIAYDSDKRNGDTQLFRDIDPDAYYPVYGDDSSRGYDAQSTGRLYVRIDKGRSYFLLGDYNTRTNDEARQLGNYNRSLNGVRADHQTSRFRGGLWASDQSTTQVIREIPANGTSGPFNFAAGNGLLGSETVEIVTRDRNQTSVILSTRTLRHDADYDFEPFSGRLLLRRPVASVDTNFNPQSLRITYEVDAGGAPFWIYGGDAQFKPFERFEIGGSFARDENPIDPYDLQSVNSTFKLAEGTYLISEMARSDTLANGVGYAGRVDLRHKSEKTEARVFFGKTEAGFENPSSQLNAGRSEGGAKVTREIAPHTQLIGEAVYTADTSGTGEREGARVDVAHTLPNQVKVTVGARASEETLTSASPVAPAPGANPATPGNISVRSVRVRVDTPVPYHPQASVFGEYEQDVINTDQRIVAAGGNYQVNTKTRLYGREEFISTLGGPFEVNSSQQNNRAVFGIETEYMQDASFYNEYRQRNVIDGGQSEASTGLRNGWNVSDGLRLSTTLERITPIDNGTATGNVVSTESTAATVGADYTRPTNWKATGRIEGRWSDTTDNYLNTFGFARKINPQWTFLTRTILNTQLSKVAATPDLWQGRILTGLAWRQTEKDEWNALTRYEYKYEDGTTTLGSPGLVRQVHMLATSVNYQPSRRWIFAGHYATKFVDEDYAGPASADYIAHLFAFRTIFEITKKWDAGLNAALMLSGGFDNAQYAIGPEVGYTFVKNVRVGLGYNVVGFTDRDFDAAATSHGLFLSLRIKFDENLLKWANFDRKEGSP
jgi:large repetitive protein